MLFCSTSSTPHTYVGLKTASQPPLVATTLRPCTLPQPTPPHINKSEQPPVLPEKVQSEIAGNYHSDELFSHAMQVLFINLGGETSRTLNSCLAPQNIITALLWSDLSHVSLGYHCRSDPVQVQSWLIASTPPLPSNFCNTKCWCKKVAPCVLPHL